MFALLGFLWSFGITSGLKFADALFLLHVGAEHLPTVYKLVACGMLLLASLLIYAFNQISIQKIFICVLCVGIIFYTIIHFCLVHDIGIHSKRIWYALRIFGSLSFAVSVTSYWTFVDHYHHLQDAKRIYCLFSSMVFIGVGCTGALMNSGWMTFQHVTLLIIAVLAATIAVIYYITYRLQPVLDENENVGMPHQSDTSWMLQIKSVLKSRFTLLLMTLNFLTFIFTVLTEYNYMMSFEHRFEPEGITNITGDEQNAQLTQFLGKWIGIVSITNIFVGLFLYSRLVRRFGIGSLIVITPIILLITFSGWTMSNALLFPIMGIFVVEGTLYVIDDNNFNLLLNAVPVKLKYKIRLIIESFFEPIGMLISSFLLSITWIDSKVLGLILSVIFLGVALGLKANYLKGIYRNLAENAIHFHRKVSTWFSLMTDKESATVKKRLLALIRQGEEKQLPMAMDGLIDFQNVSLLLKMMKQVDHMDIDAKVACVEALSRSEFTYDHSIVDYLKSWLERDDDIRLKGTIHFFLALRGLLDSDTVVEDMNSKNLMLKGAALIALKKSTLSEAKVIVEQHLVKFLSSSDDDEICMGLAVLSIDSRPSEGEVAIPFLKYPSLKVARAASLAMVKMSVHHAMRFAQSLIAHLTTSSDSEVRINCLKALGKINEPSLAKEIISSSVHFRPIERRHTETIIAAMGERVVPSLLSMTKDIHMHDRCRVIAGRTLGLLDLAQLREHLHEIMVQEVDRAYFYFYYYNTVQIDHPSVDLHVLQDALLNAYYSVLDFIIQLLGVAGELEDCELLSRSLHSPHPKVRSQVLEMLERTCETKIFRLISPLISDIPKEEKLKAYRKKAQSLLSLNELLDYLEHSSITVDQIVATTLKCRLNMPNWKNSLYKQFTLKKGVYHPFATEIVET